VTSGDHLQHPDSILKGVDEIIDRYLDCIDVGTSSPHYRRKTTSLRLRAQRAPSFKGNALLLEIGRAIDGNWTRSPRQSTKPSAANWRFEPQLYIAEHNKSAEKTLEKAQ
jgi:hypothetical protein